MEAIKIRSALWGNLRQLFLLVTACCVFLGLPANAQQKNLIQVRVFDQQLNPMKRVSVAINDNPFITVDTKGTAFTELSDADLPVRAIRVGDESLEPASWNYSKGTLEIVLRKKSYRIVPIEVLYVDGTPLSNFRITFKGPQPINVTTNSLGKVDLPLPINDEIRSADQFVVENHVVKSVQAGERNIVYVDDAKPVTTEEKPVTQGTTVIANRFELNRLDTVQSLAALFELLQSYPVMGEEAKTQLNAKYDQLLSKMSDSVASRKTYLEKISNTSVVNEDIKNLINQASIEDKTLQAQREEFNNKIEIIETKLKETSLSLDGKDKNVLLDDLNALEKLLSENESRFFKNHNDYRQIINSLKEKYFDVERLESQLTESEAKREEEQRVFKNRMLIALGILALLTVLALVLFYFSNRLRQQKKQLVKTNTQVTQINQTLEEIVQQRTVRLREANHELDTFLYRASHDLRSPLCSIKGLVNISPYLSKTELIEKVGDTMVGMDRLLKKLEMVSELSDKDNWSTIKMNSIVQRCELKSREVIRRNHIQFIVDCPVNLEFISDANLIESILQNLIENALFFSTVENLRMPIVELKVEVRDSNLILSVFDNGVGIDTSIRENIFNMFFKGHEKSKGNGLGLYIVNKAVQALQGDIVFESQPNKYTLFLVTIPIRNKVAENAKFAVAS